jgi:hypothetical protein
VKNTTKYILFFCGLLTLKVCAQNTDLFATDRLNLGELKIYVSEKETGKTVTDTLIVLLFDQHGHEVEAVRVKPKNDGLIYFDEIKSGKYEVHIYLKRNYQEKRIKDVVINKNKTTTVKCSLETREYLYKHPEVKKWYNVGTQLTTNKDNTVTYTVDGKVSNKETYEKYHNNYDDLETCCPCLLQRYNNKDELISEMVSCTDCPIGSYKEFYPGGKIIVQGQYMENTSGIWPEYGGDYQDISFECAVKTGEWTYRDEQGNILYREFWNAGEFIKQEPQQNKTEVWNVEVELNGKKAVKDSMSLTVEEIKLLKITPKYKNASRQGSLKFRFEVQGSPYSETQKIYTLPELKNLDVKKMISEADIKAGGKAHCYLYLDFNGYNNRIITLYLKD